MHDGKQFILMATNPSYEVGRARGQVVGFVTSMIRIDQGQHTIMHNDDGLRFD
jgi:hypothetical protein